MIKRLFWLLQITAFIIPVIIFLAYIIMDDGDQFTAEHYLITGLSAIPFVIVQLLKLIFSDLDKNE